MGISEIFSFSFACLLRSIYTAAVCLSQPISVEHRYVVAGDPDATDFESEFISCNDLIERPDFKKSRLAAAYHGYM